MKEYQESNPRLLKGGGLAVADQAVVGATNFLTGVLIARFLGASEYGIYALGFGLIIVAQDLQNALILTPYTVYSPRLGASQRPEYSGSALVHLGFLSLVSSLALLVFGAVLAAGYGPTGLASVCFALAAVLPLLLLKQLGRILSFAWLHIKAALLLDLVAGSFQIVGLLVLIHFGVLEASYQGFLIIGLASGLAGSVWLVRRSHSFSIHIPRITYDFKKNWKFSRWLLATVPVGNLRLQLAPWLLAFTHGPVAAGLFAACVSIASLSNPFLLGIGNYLGARTAHTYALNGSSALRKLVLNASLLVGGVLLGFLVLIGVFRNWILLWIYGSEFVNLGTVLIIVLFAHVVMSVSSPSYRGLLSLERSPAALASEVLVVVVLLSLGVWLIQMFGVMGAAVANLSGNSVGSVVQIILFTLATKMTLPVKRKA
jgi:O-antigen/teichoic acid export membrane protein